MRPLALVLLLVPATGTAGGTHLEKLSAGKIFVDTVPVEGAVYPRVTVEAVVDAPPEVVWGIINSCVASEKTFDSVMKSHVVRREGEGLVCSEKVDMPWPIRNLESVTVWSFSVVPGRWEQRWTKAGGDFDYIDGRWVLTPFGSDQRTLIQWENHFSPQISIPAWLTRAFLKIGMPDMVKDLRAAAKP